jgi:hypothetical protein
MRTDAVIIARTQKALKETFITLQKEAENQFLYLGSQTNSKNSIQEEIRLRIQAGNRSLCANKTTPEKQGSQHCQ